MYWEERANGRRYLYRSRRIPGRRPRREYVTADSDLGALLASVVARLNVETNNVTVTSNPTPKSD